MLYCVVLMLCTCLFYYVRTLSDCLLSKLAGKRGICFWSTVQERKSMSHSVKKPWNTTGLNCLSSNENVALLTYYLPKVAGLSSFHFSAFHPSFELRFCVEETTHLLWICQSKVAEAPPNQGRPWIDLPLLVVELPKNAYKGISVNMRERKYAPWHNLHSHLASTSAAGNSPVALFMLTQIKLVSVRLNTLKPFFIASQTQRHYKICLCSLFRMTS